MHVLYNYFVNCNLTMPAVSETVRPSTLDEIQTSIKGWFEGVLKGAESPIHFSHPTAFPNRLCLVSSATPDFKVQIDQRTISLQVKRYRLVVLVDDFDVRTELQNKKICFQIEPHAKPENRVLDLALREVAETKHPALVSRLLRDRSMCEKLRGTDTADALYALLTDRTDSDAA